MVNWGRVTPAALAALVVAACGGGRDDDAADGGRATGGGDAGSTASQGGSATGGAESGGASSGGTPTGGDTNGGDTSGGDESAGAESGGADTGGNEAGGATVGGAAGSTASQGGAAGSTASQGGSETEGGSATEGGAAGSTASEGGTDAGGATAGGTDTGGSGVGADGGAAADRGCPALAPASGAVIDVAPAQAGELHTIVDEAPAGSTIVLAPGTYPLARWIRLSQPGVTLRSATDVATDVVLDAAYSDAVPEAVVITANDVTVAHVTIQRAVDHPVHVYPSAGGPSVTGTLLYGVRLIDGGEQFLKVNPNGDASAFVDEGTVECSELVMTDEGRPHVETLDSGACYTGGIDVHAARGWVVRANRFQGIYCTNGGLAEHAIHFWRGARDTVVENNVIVDCARGIGFGMGSGTAADVSTRTWADSPHDGAPLGHVDGVIANNVIWATIDQFDTGIEIQQARRVTVLHNTVVGERDIAGFFSSIDYRFEGTDVVIRNNYTRRITSRDGAAGTVDHNVETESLAAFVDPGGGDFHLVVSATDAIDQGIDDPLAGLDLDGEPHANGPPDIGADER